MVVYRGLVRISKARVKVQEAQSADDRHLWGVEGGIGGIQG